MLNEMRPSRYVVEFFQTGKHRAPPNDRLPLKADTDSDAIAQAIWLARHTYHHHFQIREVSKGVQTIIYRSAPIARVA